MEPRRVTGPSPLFLSPALVIPIAGLALVLRNPSLDVHWEHHPSHFWLVSVVALLNVVLGLIVSEVAKRSRDERLFLVCAACRRRCESGSSQFCSCGQFGADAPWLRPEEKRLGTWWRLIQLETLDECLR
jgi:hypothetical protein